MGLAAGVALAEVVGELLPLALVVPLPPPPPPPPPQEVSTPDENIKPSNNGSALPLRQGCKGLKRMTRLSEKENVTVTGVLEGNAQTMRRMDRFQICTLDHIVRSRFYERLISLKSCRNNDATYGEAYGFSPHCFFDESKEHGERKYLLQRRDLES